MVRSNRVGSRRIRAAAHEGGRPDAADLRHVYAEMQRQLALVVPHEVTTAFEPVAWKARSSSMRCGASTR